MNKKFLFVGLFFITLVTLPTARNLIANHLLQTSKTTPQSVSKLDMLKIALLESKQRYDLASRIHQDKGLQLVVLAYPPLIQQTLEYLNTVEEWLVDAILLDLDQNTQNAEYSTAAIVETLQGQEKTRNTPRIGLSQLRIPEQNREMAEIILYKRDLNLLRKIKEHLKA